jgi:GntR family transcriptional regulator, rspAB operon transcriptional repressor
VDNSHHEGQRRRQVELERLIVKSFGGHAQDVPAPDVLTPLGHRTVEEALVEQLRDAIVAGSLRPGERLVYRDVARRFGVSVTPVRIALRELSKEGLVEMRAHAGARVSLLSVDELEEIFVIRIGIEGWLAELGAVQLTDEGIARMAVLLDDLKQAAEAEDRPAYLERSWAFRACCYEAAGKPRLLERTSALYDLSFRYQFLTIAEISRLAQSRRSLEEFFAACQERNGASAKRVMEDSLKWNLAYLMKRVVEADEAAALL